MQSIKFSHVYPKLLDTRGEQVKTSVLLDVFMIDMAERAQAFLAYDTDHGKYKLPRKGIYLMLLFEKPRSKSEASNLFTTLRRYTAEKFRYYASGVGKEFTIDINTAEAGN